MWCVGVDFLGYKGEIIEGWENSCEVRINEGLKKEEIWRGNMNINWGLKDI